MACLLAKIDRPEVDVRKPYTAIGGSDSFSGRTYDEQYIAPFVIEHDLPCNSTTAFLTPALRNRNITLTPDVNLVGRPPQVYQSVLDLLAAVHQNQITAEALLIETIRGLIALRGEQKRRLADRLAQLRELSDSLPLSAESIVTLIQQHLACKNASRLPVLVITAAYQSASLLLGEKPLPLNPHNAADKQTGSLGDVELTLITEDDVIASYEMKDKRVSQTDIDNALAKVMHYAQQFGRRIEHYVFVTTDVIDPVVAEYASGLYDKTGGIEFVILDCIGFLKHFLHLFHRIRMRFLEAYQELLLAEPSSAVGDPLKDAFLALRLAAEAGPSS